MNLQAEMATKMGKSRGATLANQQMARAVKPERKDPIESPTAQLTKFIALRRRDQEYAKFITTAIEEYNITPAKAEKIWDKYIKENSLYNYKTGKVIESHIDNWDSYLPKESIEGGVQSSTGAQATQPEPINEQYGMTLKQMEDEVARIKGGTAQTEGVK